MSVSPCDQRCTQSKPKENVESWTSGIHAPQTDTSARIYQLLSLTTNLFTFLLMGNVTGTRKTNGCDNEQLPSVLRVLVHQAYLSHAQYKFIKGSKNLQNNKK